MTEPTKAQKAQGFTDKHLLKPFDICVTSGEMAARQALGEVFAELAELSLDAEEIATVELVLAEAINNIVEHAYPVGDLQGQIHIECSHQNNGLHFTILDHGCPMPDGQMPLGLAQDVDIDPLDLAEGGYGWFLIKDLAKDIRYERLGAKNRLNLRIAVAIHQIRS
ncbi:MAG: ATP-binding protein [Sulfitobacter sp.]